MVPQARKAEIRKESKRKRAPGVDSAVGLRVGCLAVEVGTEGINGDGKNKAK